MQYKYHNIIFDLDGTLINSGPGIIHAVQYALKKYGIKKILPFAISAKSY